MTDTSTTSAHRHIRRTRLAAAIAGLLVIVGALSSHGGSDCRPTLTLKDVQLSAVTGQQREWTATLAVDHSSCASGSGGFRLGILRVKENAPDLEFVEQVTWELQPKKISVLFWEDEAPLSYWIDAAPCACRR